MIDLSTVHFSAANKARYRLHIIVGVVLSNGVAAFGVITGQLWMAHVSAVANSVISIYWTLE